jgi:hypothetical protein
MTSELNMLVPDHVLEVGRLLSETARPRPLSTAESRWVTELLGGLPIELQYGLDLRMTDLGPLLLGRVADREIEVHTDGVTTVVLEGSVTFRFGETAGAVMHLQRH